MSGALEGFELERPTDGSLSSIFESSLFDSPECNSKGQIVAARLLPSHFRFCLLGSNSNESVSRVLSHFPILTFAGQRVELRASKPDQDSRMIYTDELPVFNFICSHLRGAITTVNIPIDNNSTPKELHFIKQLSLFDSLSEIAFFQRSSVDALEEDEVDLLSEEQVQLYSDLISRCVKTESLKILRMPGMTLPKCLDDLAKIELKHLYLKYDEADFLMDEENKKIKTQNLHIKANYFKPSKLFSKIEAETVYLVIRFKFGRPKEDSIIPAPFVKHIFCKINYTTNLEDVFDYILQAFPELESFEAETNWGISSLCSFETFNAAEKLSASLKECFRVISRIEAAGLRAKSKGMKAKVQMIVRILMPSDDTTFFANKDAARKLRQTIIESVDGEFGKIPETDEGGDDQPLETSITLENGVKRLQKFVDHFLVLETTF